MCIVVIVGFLYLMVKSHWMISCVMALYGVVILLDVVKRVM